MIMTDSTALDSPLVDELLALLAVLKSATTCIQDMDLEHHDAGDKTIRPEQLASLSQQLSYLHTVGLQLAARWDKFRDENGCKTEFVQSLACEVRNLLSVVLSTSGLLQRHGNALDPVHRQTVLARIQQSIQDLVYLLEEATTLHGMAGLRERLRLTHVDVELLCERMIREQNAAAPGRRIRFSRKGQSRLEQIDEIWLRQTLYRVLENAIAYSPGNSVVQLKVIWTESNLAIQVKDMGIGIPDTELANVCRPFYRADNARSISGMGLGLSIAFQAMALQKGALEMTSQVGEGTTVTLHFPRSREIFSRGDSRTQAYHLQQVTRH